MSWYVQTFDWYPISLLYNIHLFSQIILVIYCLFMDIAFIETNPSSYLNLIPPLTQRDVWEYKIIISASNINLDPNTGLT
jgi:hypothetical protein